MHHVQVRPAQFEAELHQDRLRASQPDVGPGHDPLERGRVGRPDLLAQAEGREVGVAGHGVGQAVEGPALQVELPADRAVRGETRHEQVWRGHQGPDAFGVQFAEGRQRLTDVRGPVIDAGDEVVMQVDEGRQGGHWGGNGATFGPRRAGGREGEAGGRTLPVVKWVSPAAFGFWHRTQHS